MEAIEKAVVMKYHQDRLGDDRVHALAYKDIGSQQSRMQALLRWGSLSGLTVMDLGCGYGDFKAVLDTCNRNVCYLGVDFMLPFIRQARLNHKNDAHTHFVHADFHSTKLPAVDVVFACGSFNYRSQNQVYLFNLLQKLWQSAGKGMAFNLLQKQAYMHDSVLCGYDLEDIVFFCSTLTPKVSVDRSYLDDDFTILMYR